MTEAELKHGKIFQTDFEKNLIAHLINPWLSEEFKKKLEKQGGAWCNRVLKEMK